MYKLSIDIHNTRVLYMTQHITIHLASSTTELLLSYF